MSDISTQLREGMEVHTSDGAKLGKIAQVWYGSSVGGIPGSDDSCFEVHRGFLGRETLYVPCSAVTAIADGVVTLNADQHAAHENPTWHHRPTWIE